MLLKMARDAGLIDQYIVETDHVLLVDGGGRHLVRRATARAYAETALQTWWRQEEARAATANVLQ